MSARGEQRHGALVDAAAQLLTAVGPAAVTARAVAAAAGVPLAAVSYYFDSVEELLRQAAEQLYESHLLAARAVVGPAGSSATAGSGATAGTATAVVCARTLVRVWLDPSEKGPDPARVRSLLLVLPAALDQPALAPQLQRFDEGLLAMVREVLQTHGRDVSRARLLLATLDGTALARLCGVRVHGSGARAVVPPSAEQLLADLADDLAPALDALAPVLEGLALPEVVPPRAAQNSRAVGSSRPDSAT